MPIPAIILQTWPTERIEALVARVNELLDAGLPPEHAERNAIEELAAEAERAVLEGGPTDR